ncbi:MAG: hypothetical protein V8R94_03790 [Lachnospiraceae bacterium]
MAEGKPDREYYVIGCGRGPELRDEQVSIAYRKDRLNLMEMQSDWLSGDASCACILLRRAEHLPETVQRSAVRGSGNGKVFRICVNTHLDHIGAQARILGASSDSGKIKDREKVYFDAPTMITGDFNAELQDPEVEILKDYLEYTNVTEHIGITYHGFTEEDHPCTALTFCW